MTERAQRTLERFEQRRPDAFRLAMLASLAVRVDAHLLRRLRTTLTPDADVGVESDLWFSPLVESRGAHGFVMGAEVNALLRTLLAAQPALLERAAAVTAAAHRDAPATIRLEERVNALALRLGEDTVAAIDKALRPAVLAMVRDERRGLDIARWAARALPRFQPRVHEAEAAVLLAIGAAARLGAGVERPDVVASGATVADHRWVLPPAVLEQNVTVGVELLADGVRFVEAGRGSALPLPRTSPLLVHVLWNDGATERRRTIEVRPGRTERLGADVDVIRLRTLAGDEFRLAADPARTGVDAALVEVEPLGSVGSAVAGFIVAPDRIVTAAEPFRGIPILAVKHGSRSFQAKVLQPADDLEAVRLEGEAAQVAQDIIVLEPIDTPPLAPILPLEWRLSRTDRSRSNTLIVDSRADIRWLERGVVAHIEGDMGVRHDGPATIQLRSEKEETPTPPPRPGAPLLVRGRAVGIVTRVEGGGLVRAPATPGGPFRIDAVGATVIEKVLAALPAVRAARDPHAVATVMVSPPFAFLEGGAQHTFSAEAHDPQGNVLAGRVIAWSSEDREVFRLEQTSGGRVTGAAGKPGVAALKATCEAISGSAMVTVMQATTEFRIARVPLNDLRREQREPLLPWLARGSRIDARGRRAVIDLRARDEAPALTAEAHIHETSADPRWPEALDLDEAGAVLIAVSAEEDFTRELQRTLDRLVVGWPPLRIPTIVLAVVPGAGYDTSELQRRFSGVTGAAATFVISTDDPHAPDRIGGALLRHIDWQFQPGGSRDEFEQLRGVLERVERGIYPPVMPLPEFVKLAGDIRPAHGARIAGARILESGGETGIAVLDEALFEQAVLTIMDTRRLEGGVRRPLPVLPLEEMRRIMHGVLDGFRVSSDLYYAVFDGVIGELQRIGVLGVARGIDGDWLVYPEAFEPAGPIASGPELADPVLIARSATPAVRELLLVALDLQASEMYDIRGSYWRTPPRRGVEITDRRSGAPVYLEYEPGEEQRIVLRVAYGTDPESRAGLADSVEKLLRSLPHRWITIERPDAGGSAASAQAQL